MNQIQPPATYNQLKRIEELSVRLGQTAALFFSNERDVLTAAKLEDIVPDDVERFSDLSYERANLLITWLRCAESEAIAIQPRGLFGSGAYLD